MKINEFIRLEVIDRKTLRKNPAFLSKGLLSAKILNISSNQVKLEINEKVILAKMEAQGYLAEGQTVKLKLVTDIDNKLFFKLMPEHFTVLNEEVFNRSKHDTVKSSDSTWQNELLSKINLTDSNKNKLILKLLILNKMELTTENFALIDKGLQLIKIENKEVPIENKAVLSTILGLKYGLITSSEALNAIYTYLTQGKNFFAIVENVMNNFNNPKGHDLKFDKALTNFDLLQKGLHIEKNPESLLNLARYVLQTPEHILANKPIEALENNQSLVYAIDDLIAKLKTKDINNFTDDIIKKLQILKQIVIGSILVKDDENHGNFFIPFYYNKQQCHIKIMRRKEKFKKKDSEIHLEVKVEHQKIGTIYFRLTVKDKQINANIDLKTEESVVLIKNNINSLKERLKLIGYELIIKDIKLTDFSNLHHIKEINNDIDIDIDLIKIPNLDILI